MKKKQLIRSKFREAVFNRDDNKCLICGAKERLDAHHITDRNDMPNGGYVLENGISLCPEHHLMAEQYHISNGNSYPEEFHPDDLYELINSSYEKAYRSSERLKK